MISRNCLILKFYHLGLNQGPPDYEDIELNFN